MKLFLLLGRWSLILMLTLFLISCARLPVIKSVALKQETLKKCRQPFIDVPHRFIHAIEASFPGSGTGTVLGITLIQPSSKTIHLAIVTIEGLVLFEGTYDQKLYVNRAVPPFQRGDFAEYMMEDIRLMFLLPEGQVLDAGVLEDGSTICRYSENPLKIVDVIVHRNEMWEVAAYRNRKERLRHIRASSIHNGIPELLELTGFEPSKYSLRLKLISAEPISDESLRLQTGVNMEDD